MKQNKKELALLISVLLMVIFIAVTPLVVYFYKFNGSLSSKSSEWSNLGSFLSGTSGTILSAISIFALIFTLYKSSKDANKTHELNAKAIDFANKQITYMERELKIKIFNGYIESFNNWVSKKKFHIIIKENNGYINRECSLESFIDNAYRRLGISIWGRWSNKIIENRRGFDFHLPGQILSEMKVNFKDEMRDLYFILDTISNCSDDELKSILSREYHSKIDEDVLFWAIHYGYNSYHLITDILNKDKSLFSLSHRCAEEITLGVDCANKESGPPH